MKILNIDGLRVSAAVIVTMAALAAAATDMEKKAKTLMTVKTAHCGLAEVLCDDPQGWKFEATASEDAGRDVVTVRISSPTAKRPPKFGVYFRVRGDGVQNVWSTHFMNDGYHLRPKLWWGWVSRLKSMLASNSPLAVGFNSAGVSKAAVACSEAFEAVETPRVAFSRPREPRLAVAYAKDFGITIMLQSMV